MSTIENLPTGEQGHWFCSFCNDIVFLRRPTGRWDARRGMQCPVCRNWSTDWVKDPIKPAPPLTPAKAHELFEKIYDKIKTLSR